MRRHTLRQPHGTRHTPKCETGGDTMKRTMLLRAAIRLLTFLLIATYPAQLTYAHGGPPRIELSAERINPGATIEVRGLGIDPEGQVILTLVGLGRDMPLGVAQSDQAGDFTQLVALPTTLPSGDYQIRATGANRVIVSASLVIVGTADAGEEEGALRDEDDPLLAPMPLPIVTTAQETSRFSTMDLSASPIEAPIRLAIILVVVTLALIVLGTVIRRWFLDAR